MRTIGGYPVAQLESMLRQEQRQIGQQITSLRREIAQLEAQLAEAVSRYDELIHAENLLMG